MGFIAKKRIKVVREGRRDDWGGGFVWAVFPARYSDERIREFLSRHESWANFLEYYTDSWSPSMCGEFYHGAGQPYSHGYYLRRRGSRVLAIQSFGWDI
jgi:hypothetical protein